MIIGFEGTLGFVINVTLNIVVDYKYKALNLIYGNLDELINLTIKLQTFMPSSVDLLDYLSIKLVSSVAELQPFLIKFEDSQQSLEAQLNAVNQYIYAANILYQVANILYQVGFRRDDQQMQTLCKAHNFVLPLL
ncbi:MAG: hypothetical protein AB8V10_05300 [Francisella endosymbiont of Hyalomma asiaticum]